MCIRDRVWDGQQQAGHGGRRPVWQLAEVEQFGAGQHLPPGPAPDDVRTPPQPRQPMLARVRNLGLPSGLFDSWSDSLAAAWRARPHWPRSDTLGHTVEASAQRLRDHLRRPHRPIYDELIEITHTGHWKSPMPG